MRRGVIYTSGLLVLATLTLSARTATAQTTAVGPYYATPSWDQTLACTTPATCPRFIVLSNFNSEAVLDRETGLVWERSPVATLRTWNAAQFICVRKVVSNRLGWRLPSVQELLTLMDPAAPSSPTLPPGHPFSDVQDSRYWSATSNALDSNFALTV